MGIRRRQPAGQAWAALQVFAIEGGRDVTFLSRVFDKLLVNFTWWVNRLDADGSNVFEGGFLGLDNIGPIDRSHLPNGYMLEQADATGWMAAYALTMAAIAAVLNRTARPTTDLVVKFLEHFSLISEAMEEKGLWNEEDGFYYDQLRRPDGSVEPVKVRSMVGVLPLTAFAVVDDSTVVRARTMGKHFARLLERHDERRRAPGEIALRSGRTLVGVVGVDHLLRIFSRLFDESAFLSPYGLRAVSRWHLDHPFRLDMGGYETAIDYEPAESTTAMFGGNSNWRGPIWFPVNYLVVDAVFRYARYFGDDLELEYPTGSGELRTFSEIGEDLRGRLISLFLVGKDGRRPCFGWVEKLQTDPAWKDNIVFNEYFHGDNGAGLGASHQTGWTGIVADLIRRPGARRAHARRASRPDGRAVPSDRPRPAGMRQPGRVRVARVARHRRARRLRDGHRGRAPHPPLPRAPRPGERRAVRPDARARRARPGARRGRRAVPAGHGRVGVRRRRPARARAPRLVRPRRGVPRWRWQLGEIVLERELAMTHGRSAVGVVHRLVRADRPVRSSSRRSAPGAACTASGSPTATRRRAHGRRVRVRGRLPRRRHRAGRRAATGIAASAHARRRRGASTIVEDVWAAGAFAADLARGESTR